jgi:hypothetical protein
MISRVVMHRKMGTWFDSATARACSSAAGANREQRAHIIGECGWRGHNEGEAVACAECEKHSVED